MAITSLAFAGFVIAALAAYHLVPSAWKKYVLLIASLVFYAVFSWQSLIAFSLIALSNFLIGIQLSKEQNKTFWLWLGILINITSLIVFKYADFYLPQVKAVLENANIQTSADGLKILLPIGLSFFVMQGMSYLFDINKKRIPAIKYFPDFWLFALYFPKLLSGPMERAGRFIKQINQPQIVDTKTLETSLALIVMGTVRKMVLADPLTSMLPSDVFTDPEKFAPHLLAAWLLAYGFAIYNDFAGYTNIIRGVSGLFGISLTQNFNVPYFARDFTEFWQRWHISFSNWLRDYIFFPLTRVLRRKFDRKNPLNVILPPFTTMVVSGLWHGLNPHMIVWGGLHGLYQVIERIPSFWRPTIPPAKRPKWRQWLGGLVTFGMAMLAWVPFRADLPTTWAFWKQLTLLFNIPILKKAIHPRSFVYLGSEQSNLYRIWSFPDLRIFILIIPSLLIDIWQYRHPDINTIRDWSQWAKAIALAMSLLAIYLVSLASPQAPFIYQGF